LAEIAPGVPAARISMPVKSISPALRHAWKKRDNLNRPIAIASFGLITPDKALDETLQSLSNLKDRFDFHYTLVGSENPYWDVRKIIIRHGLSEHVTITGYVSLEEFERHIAATDIAINLRGHTVGETSASLCRIMSMGVPAVVSDLGWFAEIPDECVIKVSVDNNFSALQSRLSELIADSALRQRLGDRARDFVLTEHNIWRAAERYIDFTRSVIDGRKNAIRSFPVSNQPAVARQTVRANGDRWKDEVSADPPRRRLKIAYFSPLNPQPSGISDYSEELLMHLKTYLDIDLYVDGVSPDNPLIRNNFRTFDYRSNPGVLAQLPYYDTALYHIGNDYRY